MSIILKSGSSGNLANVTSLGALQVDGSGAVQPVSISGTIAVTGTFWQSVQPVSASSLPLPTNAAQESGGNLATLAGTVSSGKLQVNITNTAIAVTGTFWQAVQPISGTVAVSNFPATQPVSISSVVSTTQQGGTSGLVGDVQAKGVQGVNALMTQDFKDSGRVAKVYTATFSATTTAGLVSLTPITDGVAGTAGTSFSITAGKRFRIQAIMLTCFNATAAIHACQVNLVISPSGAVTTSSPNVATVAVTTASATANLSASQAQSFSDGYEISGTQQFGIEQQGIALAGQTVILMGYEY